MISLAKKIFILRNYKAHNTDDIYFEFEVSPELSLATITIRSLR